MDEIEKYLKRERTDVDMKVDLFLHAWYHLWDITELDNVLINELVKRIDKTKINDLRPLLAQRREKYDILFANRKKK